MPVFWNADTARQKAIENESFDVEPFRAWLPNCFNIYKNWAIDAMVVG